jgi:hypothetical protein
MMMNKAVVVMMRAIGIKIVIHDWQHEDEHKFAEISGRSVISNGLTECRTL